MAAARRCPDSPTTESQRAAPPSTSRPEARASPFCCSTGIRKTIVCGARSRPSLRKNSLSCAQTFGGMVTAAEFLVAGHDRGGRVAYRLALDHSAVVKRLALLDIVSTRAVYDDGGTDMARRYFHWYFLIQTRPLPERMIAADPTFWLQQFLPEGVDLREYLRTFGTADGIHATCEDYRAGFAVDLPHDRVDVAAGRKIVCPTTILWGSRGAVGSVYKPLEVWTDFVTAPMGHAIDCGHFIPEEKPAETIQALREFFRS
jgi:haloacetate dehalogenase